MGANIGAILASIRRLETGKSEGVYNQPKNKGGASGAYQYIDKTWRSKLKDAGLGHLASQYPSAYMAPKEIQDKVATNDVLQILKATGGDVSKVPVYWYLPAAASNPALMDKIPAAWAGNNLTPRQYQAKWMNLYQKNANVVSSLWSETKSAVDRATGSTAQPVPTWGSTGTSGSSSTGYQPVTMSPSQIPQVDLPTLLAQAMGIVNSVPQQNIDLSAYTTSVAQQREAALTSELAALDRMKAEAVNQIRNQYGISQSGMAQAGASAGTDLGALAAQLGAVAPVNPAVGGTAGIASDMSAMGFTGQAGASAVSQAAPDYASIAAQGAAGGQLGNAIATGTTGAISGAMGTMLAAMQAASLGDVNTAALQGQFKTRQASNAADLDFQRQMAMLKAQSDISQNQNRVPQLLQALQTMGTLQQNNVQMQLDAQTTAQKLAQDQAQFNANYTLQQQQLVGQLNAQVFNQKMSLDEYNLKLRQAGIDEQTAKNQTLLIQAQTANLKADTAKTKKATELLGVDTTKISASEQQRYNAINSAADRNAGLIKAFQADGSLTSASAQQILDTKNVGKVDASTLDTYIVALAATKNDNGARAWLRQYWSKKGGFKGTTAQKQKLINDAVANSMQLYNELLGRGRLNMSAAEKAQLSDSFIE